MNKHTKEIIIGHIISLTTIMEETTDNNTKARLDEQIKELMKDFNLTWDDM